MKIIKKIKKKSAAKNFHDADFFEEQFSQEVISGEKYRAIILAVISAVLVSYIASIYLFGEEYFYAAFGLKPPFLWALIILGLLGIRSFILSRNINLIYKRSRKFFWFFRYINSLIEVSVPTIVLIMFGHTMEKTSALVTPPVLMYSLFIILSILELDFKICLFAGFVAAAEYTAISVYFIDASPPEQKSNLILSSPMLYFGKSMIIFISGIIAGIITIQIKKRIFTVYKTIDERNRLEKLFGQQVSQEIVDEIIETKQEIESKIRNACIMFLDIRDFTSFSEKRLPEEIVEYQNKIFSFMIEIVNKNHGIINQILGDGFMATFGAPIPSANDCQNAFNVSTQILTELNRQNSSGEIPFTRIGIGMHYGQVVTGNVGTSFRKQYSITGNTVILASRIEQLNKEFNSNILISKEVLERIALNGFNPQFLGLVNVKGRSEPIEIYKLL
jgi:adenylate cyclase